ncbi:MAG: CvpA family protein [Clostridia bacterium]|nr:CvpA family protein [Clostridia bacterium]MBQ8513520.1 CvpA family protein [Clostridia bacterium]
MSFAIDAIILLTAVVIIWAGTSRGFIRSVMGLGCTVASLFAAYAYTPVLSNYFRTNFLLDKITSGIYETLKSLAFDTETDLYNLDRLAVDLPAPFTDILERYGIAVESFSDQLRGLTATTDDVVHEFAVQIAEPTANVIAYAGSFILIFFAVYLVLSMITSLLDLIFKMPVLRGANMFFGFVFGAAEAVLVTFLLATLLSALVTALGAIDPSLFGADVVEDAKICTLLLEHNLLEKIADYFGIAF